jgi:hypothetical protein
MTTRREFIKSAALVSARLAMNGIYSKTNAASYSKMAGSI